MAGWLAGRKAAGKRCCCVAILHEYLCVRKKTKKNSDSILLHILYTLNCLAYNSRYSPHGMEWNGMMEWHGWPGAWPQYGYTTMGINNVVSSSSWSSTPSRKQLILLLLPLAKSDDDIKRVSPHIHPRLVVILPSHAYRAVIKEKFSSLRRIYTAAG